jgi:VWFA-related protein
MRASILSVICVSLCLTNTFAQQGQTPPGQPAVTFKAEVDYVDVDTVVTDQQGRFISDLKIGDFEIFEDGKPQKIAMFSYVDLPVDRMREDRFAFGGRAATTDVKTNQQSIAGRLYVLLLDDLDTSLFRTATVRRTARRFIEQHFGPNDVAAVVYSSGRMDAAQEFTSDRLLLLAAIDKFVGRKLRSALIDKIDEQYRQAEVSALAAASAQNSGTTPSVNTGSLSAGSSTDPNINPYTRGDGYPDRTFDSDDLERGYRALSVLAGVKDLSDFLGNIHGRRKALLLFSEGIDYAMNDIFGAQEATQVVRATQDAITAAARGNVAIFGIDPRGLVGMSADAVSLDSPAIPGDSPAAAANLSAFRGEIQLSQDSLRALSDETGGFASVGANDPGAAFDRIVRANSTYYVLGYYPPSHPRDGKFHKIEVRVKRPGARVVARKGYADPRGKTPEERDRDERARLARESKRGGADTTTPELRAVLNSPMQQGGIVMLVQASPFKTTGKDHSVALAIEIDSSSFRFEERNNGSAFADKIELSYFSLSEQGKPLNGERRELELTLRPDTYQRARQTGVRINERLTIGPGRYQLRIGLRENGAGAIGTVFYDLRVPDFSNEALSMSGLLVSAGTSAVVPTLIADKLAAEALRGPATSRRTFAQGDQLAVYAEIYDNLRSQNHSVEIVTHLVAEDGRDVFASRETYPIVTQGAQAAAGTRTLDVSKQFSLKDVAPGTYLLRVEARTDANPRDARTASRETVVTVIPAPR